jgi:uncharacterized membrane protein YgdD (TMEM256/DUF423 family)
VLPVGLEALAALQLLSKNTRTIATKTIFFFIGLIFFDLSLTTTSCTWTVHQKVTHRSTPNGTHVGAAGYRTGS